MSSPTSVSSNGHQMASLNAHSARCARLLFKQTNSFPVISQLIKKFDPEVCLWCYKESFSGAKQICYCSIETSSERAIGLFVK